MKTNKMVVILVVFVVFIAAVAAVALGSNREDPFKPEIYLYDWDSMDTGSYDYEMAYTLSDPEYGDVIIKAYLTFTDDASRYYNTAELYLYDAETGEVKDERHDDWLSIDCSSKDRSTVQKNIIDYMNEYDFTSDYEEYGLRVYKMWF